MLDYVFGIPLLKTRLMPFLVLGSILRGYKTLASPPSGTFIVKPIGIAYACEIQFLCSGSLEPSWDI